MPLKAGDAPPQRSQPVDQADPLTERPPSEAAVVIRKPVVPDRAARRETTGPIGLGTTEGAAACIRAVPCRSAKPNQLSE